LILSREGPAQGGDILRKILGKLIFAAWVPNRVQSIVQRLLGGPRLETVRFSDGHLFNCFTSEKYWWLRDSYEEDERLELEACLTRQSVLFDVGSHAGFWEVVLAAKCRHIYAFEPSPQNFDRLNRNIALNQIANVTTVQAAASDETTKLHFVENSTTSHIDREGIEISAIRLSDYAAQHEAPTVIKIDIEGYAGPALKGMQGILSQSKPLLFLELHNTNEVAACHEILDSLGYKFSRLTSGTRFPYRCRASAD
jgi:FkbM family methyltransferase